MASAPFPWNNLDVNPLTEFVVENLINQAGANSGIKVSCTRVFNGEFTAGVNTGSQSGVVPDQVLQSNFWLDNSQVSQLKLSGLNHTRKYRIGFVGSSSTAGWVKGNYTATYTANGKTVYLNSWMNSTKVVYISDIVPDANGEVLVNFSTTAIAQWGFNAGMIIQDYADVNGSTTLYMSNSSLDSSTTVSATLMDEYKVKVYPNPFTNHLNIDFYNPGEGSKVTTEMYDLNGRLIYKQNYSSMPTGYNTIRVNNFRISGNGLYIVTLRVNGIVVKTVKMIRNQQY
jgi:hypothetical protein